MTDTVDMDRYGSGSTLPLYSTGPSRPPMPKFGSFASQFNISGYMMAASLFFWLLMAYLAYQGFIYGTMYMSFDDDKLEEVGCCSNFGGSMLDNLYILETYEKGDAGPYLMRLGPESYTVPFKGTQSPMELMDIPPIVTAVKSADFYHVQSLIKQWKEEIKPAFKNAIFIIYDIGLYAKELELIKAHCNCDVRTFRTSAFPAHVSDFSNFAYRPIIIQTIIEEYGSILWMNPNMVFTGASDLNQLKYRGDKDFFLWQPTEFHGTIAYTSPKMFEYLKESRCCYADSGLVDSGTMVFYRTNTSWMAIMKPWLKCALNNGCIAPPKARYSGCFEIRAPKTTGCHRYDQSAISIIMDRAYMLSSKFEKYSIPRISRQQDEYLEYFPEQPWAYTEILFVTLLPVVCLLGLCYLFYKRKQAARSKYRKR